MRLVTLLACLLLFAGSAGLVVGEPSPKETELAAQKAGLAGFNDIVGAWRGVGMPKRRSNREAWSEKARWIWRFTETQAIVDYKIEKGKLLRAATITYSPKDERLHLTATLANGATRGYTGKQVDARFVFESEADKAGEVHRLSIKRHNFKRTLVLLEKRKATQTRYSRVAEIGYTREGTRLASSNRSGPVCIVTGGLGTSQVSYQGKKYWVCCTGCREAFDDDPAGIIAEAKERAAEEKKEQNTGE